MIKEENAFLIKWRESSSLVGFISIFFGTTIVTLIAMTVSFLATLFSSGDEGTRYCFFRTIFIDIVTKRDGATSISFGMTGSYFPIIFFSGAIFVFACITYVMAKKLLKLRQHLIESR